MRRSSLLVLLMLSLLPLGVAAQDDDRPLLRGTVLYRNTPVPGENVLNAGAGTATTTDDDGRFTIPAKLGDTLYFIALAYEFKKVAVDEEVIRRNRMVVEVNEKVTELEEVTVSPEEQQEFLRLRNEDFKGYNYDTDETTEIENIALDPTVRGMKYGLNFVNIFKLLTGSGNRESAQNPSLQASSVIRQIYDDAFFVRDLGIPQEQIPDFLDYVDAELPSRTLLRKDHEFELIDFLVTTSETFRKTIIQD
ncbi:carboxypeptidase-like regulatory domain-containing protein [Robiginitalea sp. SC105]|uniref:carboxypeptidase-like regulatory domain-containing protein n=1 Tax=Robiginitalea sp. SC105 TaxID=2762332 RepID=UPI0016399B04|nr:carboxypeptidase-like regulatory domain-containing protein [Robiginitalea sp. SC105]MBC2839052.1 carboxypeptidase-like regulatory domain-containing protein [Robiginitalea sp. SC105]